MFASHTGKTRAAVGCAACVERLTTFENVNEFTGMCWCVYVCVFVLKAAAPYLGLTQIY